MTVKTTITSAGSLYEGELHRSSENFSLEAYGRYADLFFRAYYDYGTAAQREAEDVMFDIWIDEPMRRDPVYLRDIRSGHAAPGMRCDRLYLANPRGAQKDFTVVVESAVRVDSQATTLSDHKHRSSDNFSVDGLPEGEISFHLFYHYGTPVQARAEGISFAVRQNRLMHHPPVIWEQVTDGACVRSYGYERLYIADPQGASEPFTVIITEA